ncbi:MAG TPA: hypothetical protein VK579_01920 [Terriglobales bacterium]|nr:hypothetical protein [Terriglobales bacterium]
MNKTFATSRISVQGPNLLNENLVGQGEKWAARVHQSGSDGIHASIFVSFSLSATSAGDPPFFFNHAKKSLTRS